VANTWIFLPPPADPAGTQQAIQFQEESSNLGASGTATTLNFEGSGITATRIGDTVTVEVVAAGNPATVLGPASAVNNNIALFDGTTGKLIKDSGTALSAKQNSIQFQDEGSNLGASGTATTLNFVGPGVTTSRVGDVVTATIAGGTTAQETFETVSKNLKAWNSTLAYSLGKLTTITYTEGPDTIVKTFNYTGDKLTSIVLSGDTPAGIDLTKTLTYTGDSLTGVAYT
jgi:hypothetical protein